MSPLSEPVAALMYRTYYHGPIRGRRMDEVRYEDD